MIEFSIRILQTKFFSKLLLSNSTTRAESVKNFFSKLLLSNSTMRIENVKRNINLLS